MIKVIKTNDGYMVQHMDGDLEGDYVCDANGNNLWDTHSEAEAVLQAAPKLKTYKAWARQVTYLYAYVEAENYEEAQEKANDLDGSTFIDKGDGDWDIYSVEEVTS